MTMACKGHALLLSAGKLVREPVGEVIQTNRVQGITNLFIQAVGTIGRAQTKRNIFVYIHVWPKRKVLKDKTQTTLFGGMLSFFCAENTQRSPNNISPLSGVSSPAIMRSSVVFPQPEGPSSVVRLPLWIVRSVGCITVFTPNAFCYVF